MGISLPVSACLTVGGQQPLRGMAPFQDFSLSKSCKIWERGGRSGGIIMSPVYWPAGRGCPHYPSPPSSASSSLCRGCSSDPGAPCSSQRRSLLLRAGQETARSRYPWGQTEIDARTHLVYECPIHKRGSGLPLRIICWYNNSRNSTIKSKTLKKKKQLRVEWKCTNAKCAKYLYARILLVYVMKCYDKQPSQEIIMLMCFKCI